MPTHDLATRRARAAVVVLFVLAGAAMGGWASRIPSVKEQVGLGDAGWGVALLALPIGTLLVLLVLPRLITRTGARVLALPGAVVLLCIAPVSALSQHPVALSASLLVQGMAVGLLFTPMNALAVEVERGYGRSILSSFHAFFSLGQLSGGLAGALAGSLGVRPSLQLAATDLVLAVLLASTARFLPYDAARPTRQPRPKGRLPVTPQLLLLATMALLTSINEGTATTWSAQYSVSLGSSIAIGSLTLVCYSVSIALVRLVGDVAVERLGRVRFLMASATVSAVGMSAALLAGSVPMAMAGFALLGVGSGCVVPTIMGLAGNQPDVASGRGVALVSLGEWPAFLLGPPLIGVLSELVTLRGALGLLVVSSLVIVALSTRVAVPRQRTV